MKDLTLIYMVAGMSSRFGGKMKMLARVGPNNETLLEYSLKQSLSAGFSKIIFVVSSKTKQAIYDEFGKEYNSVPIYYTTQELDSKTRDKPWGTTDALCSSISEVNEPFVVCNGDDIYGEEPFKILFNHLQNSDDCATIGYKLDNVLPENGSVNRGIFQVDNEGFVQSVKESLGITRENFQEKGLQLDSLCNMNLFALTPEALNLLNEKLQTFKQIHNEERKIEAFLPEDLGFLITQGKIKIKLYSTDDSWIGITNPEDEDLVKEKLKNE